MKYLKALTFSYDDGIAQDIRFIELLNKYGMKGTFNINSGRLGASGRLEREGSFVDFNRIKAEDLRYVYEGHEVAGHGITHPKLPELDDDVVIREVENDRIALSELCGYEVVGLAYPFGTHDERVEELIRAKTGIKYCRTVTSTHGFEQPTDLYALNPSIHVPREWDTLFALGEQFLSLPTGTPALFYVWGHTFEFDIHNTWDRFEEFLKMMSAGKDITYATNKELLL